MERARDIAGQTFGYLTAKYVSGTTKEGKRIWACECKCGNVANAIINNLTLGHTKSCGCLRTSKKDDLVGRVFGRLTAVEDAGLNKHRQPTWRCLCECGNEIVTTANSLKTGNSTSCGCLRDEKALAANTKHGMCKHPLYGTWHAMTQRCHNPVAHAYEQYGGRGITVADEFRDVTAFIDYVEQELGPKPSKKHTIDRIDNNRGYERGNLRWATRPVQARNRRGLVLVSLCGQEMTLTDACEIFGLNRFKAYYRHSAGWPLVDVFLGKPKRAAA